jgi:hypothetical protein
MDPIVEARWLAGVIEGKTLLALATIQPSLAIGFAAVMVLSLAVCVRQAFREPSTMHVFAALSTLLAGLYGSCYIKLMPYGMLLALVPLACWIARRQAIGETSAFAVRLGAVLLASQTFFITVSAAAIGFVSDVEADAKKKLSSSIASCLAKTDIASLSQLSPGLVIADIDLGPFIAVSTHHRAYAGPYHRVHRSIRDVLRLQDAPIADAGHHLERMNADYLVLCGLSPDAAKAGAETATFADHMRRGGAFPGLQPVDIGKTEGPLRVWKIVREE